MDGWIERETDRQRSEGERKREKQKSNRVNVNICKIWMKAILEGFVLFLQLSCESEIISKQKIKLKKILSS